MGIETSIRDLTPEKEEKRNKIKTSQRTSRIPDESDEQDSGEGTKNKTNFGSGGAKSPSRGTKEKSIESRWFFTPSGTHTHTHSSRRQWKYLKQTKRNGGGEEGKIKKRRTKLFCSKKSINLEMREREDCQNFTLVDYYSSLLQLIAQ
mmetsp:Transcript_63757/g.73099  ORF Transcript_63757/g.73099 Transcript_63757/m.73099 type:complete len:148 (-) Transcript_63757:594-1037(-)